MTAREVIDAYRALVDSAEHLSDYERFNLKQSCFYVEEELRLADARRKFKCGHSRNCRGVTPGYIPCTDAFVSRYDAFIDGEDVIVALPKCRGIYPVDFASAISEETGRAMIGETRQSNELSRYLFEHGINMGQFAKRGVVPFIKSTNSKYYFLKDIEDAFANEIYSSQHGSCNDTLDNQDLEGELKKAHRVRCFVYAMRNRRNGFIKLGLSTNPSYRERTLQSQEPEVELIAQRVGDREEELWLHKTYKDYRLRGEWFSIPDNKVADLLKYFNP